jgi:hypothetical protein
MVELLSKSVKKQEELLSTFQKFLSALKGNAIKITDTNDTELERFCEQFCFSELAAKLSEFPSLMDFKEAENARGRIAVLEEKANRTRFRDCSFAGQSHSTIHGFAFFLNPGNRGLRDDRLNISSSKFFSSEHAKCKK